MATQLIEKVYGMKFKFDEQLTGLEDINFGIKSIDAGWKIFYSRIRCSTFT